MDDETPTAKELFCKTKLCKFYAAGRCKQGRKCSFAHGTKNMAPMPDFYQTRMCPSFIDTGTCKNGDACSYAHSAQELRSGVTKATSNAANLSHGPTTLKAEPKPRGLRPRTSETLKQLLVNHGVPEAPGKVATSSSTSEQPHITEPEAEPYTVGGARLTTEASYEACMSLSYLCKCGQYCAGRGSCSWCWAQRMQEVLNDDSRERLVRANVGSAIANGKLPLSQMQPMKVTHSPFSISVIPSPKTFVEELQHEWL